MPANEKLKEVRSLRRAVVSNEEKQPLWTAFLRFATVVARG